MLNEELSGIRRSTEEHAILKFHQGEALMRLASTIYHTLQEAILEAVQNSIDADATAIEIVIDRKARILVISDNGTGITPKRLNDALTSIAMSVKPEGKYGRFGLGFISFLGKAHWHKFVSATRGGI